MIPRKQLHSAFLLAITSQLSHDSFAQFCSSKIFISVNIVSGLHNGRAEGARLTFPFPTLLPNEKPDTQATPVLASSSPYVFGKNCYVYCFVFYQSLHLRTITLKALLPMFRSIMPVFSKIKAIPDKTAD